MQDAAQEPVRVLVAEDNEDLRAAVCALLDVEDDFEVAGEAGTTRALRDGALATAVDVIVLDLNLGGESSIAAMQDVRRALPRVGVVVYSGYDARDIGAGLGTLQPCEYVSKSGESGELLDAIRRSARAADAKP
jgi:two-component system response regulator DesR